MNEILEKERLSISSIIDQKYWWWWGDGHILCVDDNVGAGREEQYFVVADGVNILMHINQNKLYEAGQRNIKFGEYIMTA